MSKNKIIQTRNRAGLYDRIALAVCVIFLLVWFSLLMDAYYHFGYRDWDFALYAQAMWSLVNGSLEPSLFGVNFLSNHAQYISFFLAPVYFVFRHPLTLIFLKILSTTTGAYILYKIAAKKINPVSAIVLMLLYLTYPANVFMILYEFHFENLAIALIFLLYYAFLSRKFRLFCITMFFLSTIKENMPLIVIAFGIYALFSKKHENKICWAFTPMIFGALMFTLSMFVITPILRAGLASQNQYLSLYASIGQGPLDIMRAFFTDPARILKVIFQAGNIQYASVLFAPLLLIPLFSPHILFLGSPVFLQHFLSSAATMKDIYHHYAATLLPFIFLAAACSLTFFKNKVRRPFFTTIMALLIAVHLLNWVQLKTYNRIRFLHPLDEDAAVAVWQMIDQIPREAGVVASLNFLDQLSQRRHLQSFLTVARNINVFTGKPFELSGEFQYALLDLNSPWVRNELRIRPRVTGPDLRSFFHDHQWAVHDAYNEIVLLKRGQEQGVRLVEYARRPFKESDPAKAIEVNGDFTLLDIQFNEHNLGRRAAIPLTFYWKSVKAIKTIYYMVLSAENDRDTVRFYRAIGSISDPTHFWREGDFIKENFWISTARLSPGTYSLDLAIYDMASKETALLKLPDSLYNESIAGVKFADIIIKPTVPAHK